MITLEAILLEIRGVDGQELGRWIEAELVRAEGDPGQWRFTEMDVARIRLLVELRHELEVEERTLPIVLSLMDQLYDVRRRMTRLNEALAEVPAEVRKALFTRLD